MNEIRIFMKIEVEFFKYFVDEVILEKIKYVNNMEVFIFEEF